MQKLLDFLNRLEQERIAYSLAHNTADAIMVLVAVPGERWEIEFFADTSIEIEVFNSGGVDEDTTLLDALFKRHGEQPIL